jgi:hypothetical protein
MKKRVCVFSQRHLKKFVSRCADYEFENIIQEIDDADLVAIGKENPFIPFRQSCSSLNFKLTNPIAKRISPNPLNISPKKQKLTKEYDIFFALCMSLNDLQTLKYLKGWKKKCKKLVCQIDEIWAHGLEKRTGELKLLSQFDYIFVNCKHSVNKIQKLTGKPCYFVLPGIDAILFCPYPNPPKRTIDVFYIGRRSKELHNQLLSLSDNERLFYIYDSISTLETDNIIEHRKLLSNLIKRSKFYIVNSPKFDREYETFGQYEIGYRFFEGAASGAVMIGDHLKGEGLKTVFHWPHAVSKIPDISKLSDFLDGYNNHTQKVNSIRCNSIINTLRYHDWSYRWEFILKTIGEKTNEKSYNRSQHLLKLSNSIENEFAKFK